MSTDETRPPRLVAAGYTTLDTIRYDGRLTHRAGGTAANVAGILAWLGWKSHLAAFIGDDPAGRRLSADLKRLGVNVDHLTRHPTARTPQIIHEIDDGTHRFLFRCPECGRRFPRSRPFPRARAHVVLDDLDDVGVFFFDRANPGTLALADEFRRRGSLVVFEPSVAGSTATTDRAVELAHVVKFSDDRLSVLWSALPAPAPDQIQVVTRGEHGAVARRGQMPWAESTAFEAHVVDPGGAGDWTTAGLLYKLGARKELDEDQLIDALRFGQALAALSCEWPGARGLLTHRTIDEVVADAERLLRAKPRRRRAGSVHRRTQRRADACEACLAPRSAATDAVVTGHAASRE